MRSLSALVLVVACIAGVAAADPPPPAAQRVSASPSSTAGRDAGAAGFPSATPYSYQPDGRRDPFQSLTATTPDDKRPRPAAAGIAGIRVDELSVRGIMQSRDRLVAMVTGPDNRTYVVHSGDKLADGMVKSINPQGLVLMQDVTDPRATDKTREVRKPLRSEDKE